MDALRTKRDGRRQRAERHEAAVIDALLDLFRAGRLMPGAAEIAARAGVSERTVFRLFDDLEALVGAAVERQTARVSHLFAPPDSTGDLEARIDALVAQRLRLYVETGPIRRAALLRLPLSPALQEGFTQRGRLLRRQVERQFHAELAALAEPERAEVTAAIEAASGIETLDTLCHVQGLPEETAAAIVRRTLRALLRTAGCPAPEQGG
jgi:AcrR family transcriptional regulator